MHQDSDPIFNATLNAVQELLKAELSTLTECHVSSVGMNVWARSLTQQALAKGVLPTRGIIHEAVVASSPAGVLLY
jgi:hypothetical protein